MRVVSGFLRLGDHMLSSLFRRGCSQAGGTIIEQSLVFAILLPLVIVAVHPIGVKVRRTVYCSVQVAELAGGGSSTTEDAAEARAPDPNAIVCTVPATPAAAPTPF